MEQGDARRPPARRSTDRAIALVALALTITTGTLFAQNVGADRWAAVGYGLGTLVAAVATGWLARLAFRRWRGRDR